MTRQEFLRLTTGGSAGLVLTRLAPHLSAFAPQAAAAAINDRIARIISTYDRQGIHRTATEVDNRSAAWLMDAAKAAGADARTEPFAINRIDPRNTFVEIQGRRIEGLPLFDGGFTDERGIVGKLTKAGEAGGEIAVIAIDANGVSSEGRGLQQLRRAPNVRAIIAITSGAHAGLTPSNAVDFKEPYGVPVLQVSSEESAGLVEHAAPHHDARLVAQIARTSTQAHNVVGVIRGTRAELPPVVVMTPRSGWWQCAGERGGGIVCWLETMRAVSAARTPRTVMFVASSGHELGHYGLDAFIDAQPDLVKRAAAWMHFGANIGAAEGRGRLQSSSDEIEAKALEQLTRAAAAAPQRVPRGTVPGGEARNIHVGGARYVSFLGSSPVFHSQADRWPAAVDVQALARYAAAFSNLAVALASAA